MSDAWLKEQREVWGDGEAFGAAVRRLQACEDDLQAAVARAVEARNANDVITEIVNRMFPDDAVEAPENAGAISRFKRLRSEILYGVQHRIDWGAPSHAIAQYVANAVLIGKTEYGPAVEVFPDGYNASAKT